MLLLTLNGEASAESKNRIVKVLDMRLTNGRVQSIAVDENQTTIHYSFTGMSTKDLDGLHETLKEIAPVQKLNFYFNRQGILL